MSPPRRTQLVGEWAENKLQMGLAEAGQWMGSSALARGPWSQDRPPRRMAGEERMGMLLQTWQQISSG